MISEFFYMQIKGRYDVQPLTRNEELMEMSLIANSTNSFLSCPRKNGIGKFRIFTDQPHFFGESQPLYPMYKYRIYLNQLDFFIYETVFKVIWKLANLL